MTRRAKERRKLRAQEKKQLQARIEREQALSERSEWKQLLASIDYRGDAHRRQSSEIVGSLQWKSSSVPIPASEVFQLPIKIDAPRAELQYDFSTLEFDICFGVEMVCGDGTMVEVMEMTRYESQKQAVVGRLELRGPGLVFLTWDNSFSWLNPKQLAYAVELRQETPHATIQKKAALALTARQERERLLMQREGELDVLEQSIAKEEARMDEIRRQIDELQAEFLQCEQAKASATTMRDKVELQVETLEWEIRALGFRSFSEDTIVLVLSLLDEVSLRSLSCSSKKWQQYVQDFGEERRHGDNGLSQDHTSPATFQLKQRDGEVALGVPGTTVASTSPSERERSALSTKRGEKWLRQLGKLLLLPRPKDIMRRPLTDNTRRAIIIVLSPMGCIHTVGLVLC